MNILIESSQLPFGILLKMLLQGPNKFSEEFISIQTELAYNIQAERANKIFTIVIVE